MSELTTLLVNLGTPARASAEDVRVFLEEFLSDPRVIDLPRWLWRPILRGMVLRRRPERVAALYRSIWYEAPCTDLCPGEGCSPLECGTRRIAAQLERRLSAGHRVDWCYRYGERSIHAGLRAAIEAGSERIQAVPLFPQRTGSTTGSIADEVERAAGVLGIGDRVELLEIPPDDAGYARGLADRARGAIADAEASPEHLLVSFHGLPARYDRREGGVYVHDCERTTEALLAELDWDAERATMCFQSKFGPEPWLRPATAERIEALAAEGIRHLAVLTPGFLTEGLETLEEIGQRGRETFLEAGGETFTYLPAVEDHPAFVDALALLAAGDAIGLAAPESAEARTGARA